MGADTVNVVPHGHFQSGDGRWLAIACSNDTMFARLARTMGQPELADPDRLGPKEARLAAREEINRLVADWVGSITLDEALARCRDGEVPAGPVYSIADIFTDPQYAHRGTITTEDSRIGPLAVPGTIPALSETPGAIRWLGRALGADTNAVLEELLGLSTDEVDKLRENGVI
jgi:crotonobetainyl-CoA:carnitine CoA-transferase CaiB-like acyl-CoA transferase